MDEGKPQPRKVAEDEQPLEERDLVFVRGPTERGDGYSVIRSRTGNVEVGELRALRSGQPIQGEVVSLTPISGHDQLFEVDVLVEPPKEQRGRVGPARVTSNAYRQNWDAIFGGQPEDELN
jgi:hypothetical protein